MVGEGGEREFIHIFISLRKLGICDALCCGKRLFNSKKKMLVVVDMLDRITDHNTFLIVSHISH